MKSLIGLLLAFMLLLSTSLFAGGKQEVKKYDPDSPVTITLGGYGDLETAYKAVVESKDFKSKYPNMKVKFVMNDFAAHHDRLTTAIAAGKGAFEVEAIEIGYIAKFVASGGLTNLSGSPFNAKAAVKNIVKYAVSNATTKDGKIIAIPVDIAPAVMFYRKSLADKAGVDLSGVKSWDEYIKTGRKLTVDKNGDGKIDQYALTSPESVWEIPLNGGKGGWFDKNGNVLEPKERFINVLNLVKKIREAGIDADLDAWSQSWLASFKTGLVATHFSGAWWGGALRTWVAPKEKGDWRVAYPPGKALASIGGTYLSIPEQIPVDKKLPAWELIKYLTTNPAAQLITFKKIDAFPSLTTIFNDPVMDEPVAYFGNQKARKLFAEIALKIPESSVSKYDVIARDIWITAVTNVIIGKASVEAAYDKAKKQIENRIQ
ncbi:MAG: extracellular solute-binding protein [Spirochaetes bacterium]|nr:extracellular solute-binding protein [Spirochaetota bacterium]